MKIFSELIAFALGNICGAIIYHNALEWWARIRTRNIRKRFTQCQQQPASGLDEIIHSDWFQPKKKKDDKGSPRNY